jgi:hypothetical protein
MNKRKMGKLKIKNNNKIPFRSLLLDKQSLTSVISNKYYLNEKLNGI